jgi:hypothetical protein
MDRFDERNLLEIRSPAYPGERLMVGRNPSLPWLRAKKREVLLVATEEKLRVIQAGVEAGQRTGAETVGLTVGKHFALDVCEQQFTFMRKLRAITFKINRRQLDDGSLVQSFSTLMAEFSTLVRNTCRVPRATDASTFEILTTPTHSTARSISSNTSEGSQKPVPRFQPKTLPIMERAFGGWRNFGLIASLPCWQDAGKRGSW